MQLNWVPYLNNASTTYQVEYRLPGGAPAVVQSGITALNYLHTGMVYEPGALYRVAGFKGGLKTALSLEVSITGFYSGDGDQMADSWELRYFGGTNAANGGAIEDYDFDLITNLQEYRYHLDPGHPPVPDAGGTVGLQVYTPHDPLN